MSLDELVEGHERVTQEAGCFSVGRPRCFDAGPDGFPQSLDVVLVQYLVLFVSGIHGVGWILVVSMLLFGRLSGPVVHCQCRRVRRLLRLVWLFAADDHFLVRLRLVFVVLLIPLYTRLTSLLYNGLHFLVG
ncbi:hypothetical protein TKK_0011368 [Trichogramma kaykai]